ncbi:hypothetical protein VPLG_00157 [Vibrio phage eugene 12A10]|uniref:hypothetical protein n=1 Tax=Vibrio phage eugene 12A10 TaxID=573172 RepID=UPI000351CBD7|nr:hypothetical protein VPLG_00157 [Vibrio phage eugene 12A10]AGN51596.1 hypothetical protein VPLG_00157 [Vibrio phage eugene 12A10]
MENLDYAIMYVEEKLGTGAVMEMMDYIEEKKGNEGVTMSKYYIIRDLTFSIGVYKALYYKSWDGRYEVGDIEGMELTEHKDQAFKFHCPLEAHKFIEQNGLRGHCFVEEVCIG